MSLLARWEVGENYLDGFLGLDPIEVQECKVKVEAWIFTQRVFHKLYQEESQSIYSDNVLKSFIIVLYVPCV